MSAPPLTLEEALFTKDIVEKHLREGAPPPGTRDPGSHGAVKLAALDMGLDKGTLWSRVCPGGSLEKLGVQIDWGQYSGQEKEETRRDKLDTDFWRKKYRASEKELAHLEKVLEELSGIRQIDINVPSWYPDKSQGTKSGSVIGLLLSDVHAGEVIEPDEVLGVNGYNPDICRARLRRLFAAAIEIGQRWTSDTDCQGFLLCLGGDLISGDIHEELRITNSLTSHEQVKFMVEEVTAGILNLLEAYPFVQVVSVPGNHGRTTMKPPSKMVSKLSYDQLIASMISDGLAGNPRVSFDIARGRDVIGEVFGLRVLLSHGDAFGTGGGQGFLGPIGPIVRGAKKVEAQQAGIGQKPDLILHGHWHTSSNAGNILSNGSVVGYGEYINGLRARVEPPQQWLFLLHSRWGLRERCEIKLS